MTPYVIHQTCIPTVKGYSEFWQQIDFYECLETSTERARLPINDVSAKYIVVKC